ncbi:MAG: bile acid:sodium symporter [Bacteroidales bacterium]|nr:bile acid:sodium symporter [Bacteroidales bacterium]
MGRIIQFLKDWMLPVAIAAGILIYLALHFINPLSTSVEPLFSKIAKEVQPVMVAVMLFLQFNKISPHDLRFRRWHLWLLVIQTVVFVILALIATTIPHGNTRILLECAMLCFICPTAAASGVITDKLGGSLADNVTYVVLINILAAFIIPAVIPIVHPAEGVSFLTRFFSICMRVFPLLVLPLLLSWLIRFTMKKLHDRLLRIVGWAFYIWGFTLCLSIYLATKALVTSGISVWVALLICLVSLVCTIVQFAAGRVAGKHSSPGSLPEKSHADAITAGQALGQKNNGFLIWLGYSWMTPVTSVAGGLYSIWQNLFNAYELYEQRKWKKDS